MTNKEIKFRAHEPITGVMSKSFTLADLTCHEGIYIEFPDGDYHRPEHCELMQFTGLKDKNGVEIYEGDIIHETIDGEKFILVVGWNPDETCFDLLEDGGWTNANNPWDIAGADVLEVIGNIHENPELLK